MWQRLEPGGEKGKKKKKEPRQVFPFGTFKGEGKTETSFQGWLALTNIEARGGGRGGKKEKKVRRLRRLTAR